MRFFFPAAIIFASFVFPAAAAEPATQTSDDPDNAASIYIAANAQMKIVCPSASRLEYSDIPPYPPEWMQMESDAFTANRAGFELVRGARKVNQVEWPAGQQHLNGCRNLTNQLGDAALWEHLQGNHAASIEYIRDILHMVDLLQTQPRDILHPLVGAGVASLAAHRAMIIASAIGITTDPADKKNLQLADAKKFITELLVFHEPIPLLSEALGKNIFRGMSHDDDRIVESINRGNTERTFAAISLACHCFYFENNRWPEKLDELVPGYFERVPLDSWGDGRETLGYVAIKGGLPDGKDRPLVYSRCQSSDGLFYRIDEPQFGFYSGNGTNLPPAEQPKGGQFRDIARWSPTPGKKIEPTTQRLP